MSDEDSTVVGIRVLAWLGLTLGFAAIGWCIGYTDPHPHPVVGVIGGAALGVCVGAVGILASTWSP